MSAFHVGSSRRLRVREESVEVGARARFLYASDLHLGLPWTRNVGDLLDEALDRTGTDTILLGGDLVNHGAGVRVLEPAIARLARRATVAAVPGNHDRRSLDAVRGAVLAGGGRWLPDAPLVAGDGVRIDGRLERHADGSAPRILCAHEPDVFPVAAKAGYAAVLAGHLHGCQFVAFRRGGMLHPGAWFYRWNGLRFRDGRATMLVSTGCADALPLRWNCPREVLLCTLS